MWLRNFAICAAKFDSVFRVKLYSVVILHISEYDVWCFCSFNAIIFYSKLFVNAYITVGYMGNRIYTLH